MRLLDCTLRDGANIAGLGFDKTYTNMMLEGMIRSGIDLIEFGNAHGMGMNEPGSPLSDEEYLELMQPYRGKAEFGMFLQSKAAGRSVTDLARKKGLSFLRIGNNAGDGTKSIEAIRMVKESGLTCRYSLMKAYLLTPGELAEEAAMLEEAGTDEITIMDSAGTMLPEETAMYVEEMKKSVTVPIGFHGHNNMGLAVSNSCTAYEHGASVLDTGLMGMARSAGNCPTEVLGAVLMRRGINSSLNLYTLLEFIDRELSPAMQTFGFDNPIPPVDLIYGLTGCHSNYGGMFAEIAAEKGVSLFQLITKVCEIDKKAPTIELINRIAGML